MLSAGFAQRFGKKAVAVAGFTLSTVNAFAFYFLAPDNATGMILLTICGSIFYAPTIPLVWAIYADVADYSEWQTGRRFTGMVFATIGFALKSGLALGSAGFLWAMAGLFGYDTKLPSAVEAIRGYHACAGLGVGFLFAICTVLLVVYKLNQSLTLQISADLADRRVKLSPA
jgi:Na+/melibiose symporter-like transporter